MNKYLLLLFIFSFNSLAANFIAVQSSKPHLSKSDYSLSLVDSETSKILKSVVVDKNLIKRSHWFLSDSGQYFVFYRDQRGNDDGMINIYNSNNLELLSTIKTEKLLYDKKAKRLLMLKFNHDESKLLFLSKIDSKFSNLNVYDLKTNKLRNEHQVANKIDGIELKQSILAITGKKNSWLSVFNINSNKLLLELNENKTKYQAHIDNSYIYLVKKNKKQPNFELEIVDSEANSILAQSITSKQQPKFATTLNGNKSYFAIGLKQSINIYEIVGNQLNLLAQETLNSLKKLLLLPNSNELVLVREANSKDEILIYNLNNFSNVKKITAPIEFDFISRDKKIDTIWLKGKKLAYLDLKSGKTLGEATIGSTGAKVQKVIVGVTMAAISTSLAYAVFKGDGVNNIEFLLNSNADKAFISSSITNDISIFETKSLNNKHLYNVRENMLGLFKNSKNNIVGISKKSMIFFNEDELEPFKIRRFNQLLGVDLENKVLYSWLNSKIVTISINSSKNIQSYDIENVIEVFIP